MDAEKKILELAIEKGLLSRDQAADKIETLMQKGVLDQSTILALQSELENRMAAATAVDITDRFDTRGISGAAAEERINRFGHFENLEFVGQGGMAKVYKAFDVKLGRVVALKMLRVEDQEMAARLMMEAKAQARIEHEHVCKVFEVGDVDGSPYIAMQFINGSTLKELRNQLPLELKLKLFAEVADAVHSAHRAGLIHRDLKPANVIVERTEEGEYIPYVMDFGLAREMGSGGLTETGRVIGTIFYMSPEQARGHVRRLDRRSDIYSLGVTLYELIAEQLPYEMTTDMEFLMTLVDETKPLIKSMDGGVPGDLQTIVMKCVEKEPRRRYDSAKALADDIRRFLDGEPILAKRTHFMYWLFKKARKHRMAVAASAIALAAVLALFGSWLSAKRDNAERIRVAQELGQRVERIEGALRYSRLLPIHNARAEIEIARREVESMVGEIQTSERRAGLAPAYYAAGRGYLALGDPDKARQYLETAWNAGYRTTDVSYALGRTLGTLYQREIDESEQTGTKLSRQLKKKKLEKEYREPALRHLLSAGSSNLEAADYYRALLAYYDGRYPEAIKLAAQAQARIPWFYEALRLEGDVYAAQARDRDYRGDFKGALELFDRAEDAYDSAIRIGSSDSENYARVCRMKTAVIKLVFYKTSLEPKREFEQAIAYCDQAAGIDPANAEFPAFRAMALNRWGEYLLFNGQDPEPPLQKAVESAKKAALLNPADHYAQHNLGFSHSLLANYRIIKNENPLAEIDLSAGHYRKALALKPGYIVSLSGLGLVYQYKADYLSSIGSDPAASFESAIVYRKQAVENDPLNTDTMNNLGNCYNTYADYLIDSGRDPASAIRQAIEVLRNAIAVNPDEPLLRSNLVSAYLTEIRFEKMMGRDPSDAISRCLQQAEENVKLNPDHELSRYELIEATLGGAENEINFNRSPNELIASARTALEEAGSKDSVEVQSYWGQADFLSAKANAFKHQSPERFLASAIDHFRRELDASPMDQMTMLRLGDCYLEQGKWRSRSHNSTAALNAGLQIVDAVLQKNPRNPDAWLMKAELLSAASANRTPATKEIQKALEQAVKINRNLQWKASQLTSSVAKSS